MSAAAKGYDTIVVGAGPAGCAIANRLGVDPARRVALVEAAAIATPAGPAPLRQNPPMTLPSRASRRTLWAVACMLALKSAVPLLASFAAAAQGRPVAEICQVYGVATVGGGPAFNHHPAAHHHAEYPSSSPAPEHGGAGAHAGDHCALTALAAGAPPGAPCLPSIALIEPATARASPVESQLRDACAEWAAQLRHGPPALA